MFQKCVAECAVLLRSIVFMFSNYFGENKIVDVMLFQHIGAFV